MKRLSLVLTLMGGALTLIPQHLLAGEDVAEVKEFIVKTQNPDALQGFVEDNGLQIGPLIRYPNPSEEVIEMFGCYRIVTIPETLQSVRNSMVDQLKCLPGVDYVGPNTRIPFEPEIEEEVLQNPFNMPDSFSSPYTPNDPLFPLQWSKRLTQTDWAWNVSTGEGVKIALIDTAIELHEDLADNLDLENAWNFAHDTPDVIGWWMPHATRVAGIAAAKIDNGKGIAGIAGNASIMPLVVFDAGSEGILESDVVEAIIYAVDKGAKIINMSIGNLDSVFLKPTQDAIEYAWDEGLFLSGAAGNGNQDTCIYPAAYEHVMACGATNSEDGRWDDGMLGSNYGSAIDIYAPGGKVVTTWVWEDSLYTDFFSGTSFAAPAISGLAALIWSVHPEWTNQELWDKIIESADTITIDKGQVLRMNARKALDVEIGEGIAEEVIADARFEITTPIGSQIVLNYSNCPQGFAASVFDAVGRKADEVHAAGISGQITWGEGYGPGVYFIRSEKNKGVTRKIILIN